MNRTGSIAVILISTLLLAGCAGAPPAEPSESGPAETTPPETVVDLPELDGEWVATRTVVEGDASSEVYAVGYTEDRLLGFETSTCDETCAGTVQSGVTLDGRSETAFTQSGAVIAFQFEGLNDCLDLETGALLYTAGYQYVLEYELAVDSTDASGATGLSGTALNVYSATPEALAAGCETGGRITYDVRVVRG